MAIDFYKVKGKLDCVRFELKPVDTDVHKTPGLRAASPTSIEQQQTRVDVVSPSAEPGRKMQVVVVVG
jgi:hypothetical protein